MKFWSEKFFDLGKRFWVRKFIIGTLFLVSLSGVVFIVFEYSFPGAFFRYETSLPIYQRAAKEAQFIFIGTVLSTNDRDFPFSATLKIEERLKGRFPSEQIVFRTGYNTQFSPGERILVILEKFTDRETKSPYYTQREYGDVGHSWHREDDENRYIIRGDLSDPNESFVENVDIPGRTMKLSDFLSLLNQRGSFVHWFFLEYF